MDGINFIQDLAVVLLAAGLAGALCKRIGLSVIVGYLVAGIVVGPYTPPFSFVTDVDRIQTLSQVGLVFLMFAIGLGLSLTKLRRMGLPTLIATGLGAFFVLHLTQILGAAVGWNFRQSLFVAAMFMVSSSAVIAKIVGELKLGHEGAAQRALAITVLEDVVAVVMLTILASQTQGGEGGVNVGGVLATMSAFVVLLVGAGLLFVPRLFRRLESRADPELQTIVVAGVLFLLALCAARAGYSLALGAFLLGAIVAEMPQKAGVEKAFAGMRDVFSSVFFVSIGLMIDVKLLLHVWPWIIGLFVFVLATRPLALGLALVLCGTAPREARRAGLLLTPLGEFTFIIAQLGVVGGVLPGEYYPLSVGVAILTVLATPLVNRHADSILGFAERIEPRWISRSLEAYAVWLSQIQSRRAAPAVWRLIRGRLVQIGVEMLFISGLLIFSRQIFAAVDESVDVQWLDDAVLPYVFWGVIGLVVLSLLLAIWRNIAAASMLFAESVGPGGRLPPSLIERGMRTIAAVLLGWWLYFLIPLDSLPGWGWAVVGAIALGLATIGSSRLIYWHSAWQSSVQDVFQPDPPDRTELRASARLALDQGLGSWGLRLEECVVPDAAVYAGCNLAQLGIPARFGCSVIEIERNGCTITRTGPDLQIYPGDKLLLLGDQGGLAAACAHLQGDKRDASRDAEAFAGSILETQALPDGPHSGRTLADLQVARATGVRVVGIQRGDQRFINPDGNQMVMAGDNLLVVGTLDELKAFRQWLRQLASDEPRVTL